MKFNFSFLNHIFLPFIFLIQINDNGRKCAQWAKLKGPQLRGSGYLLSQLDLYAWRMLVLRY